MEEVLYNPFLLIFGSYGIGAALAGILKGTKLYQFFLERNYLSDQLTYWSGALLLGKLIRSTPLGLFNQSLKYKGRPDAEKLIKLKQHMELAEIGHLIAFFYLFLFLILLFPLFTFGKFILMHVLNVVLNLYLVFLQQYNKRRIERLLEKMK